MTNDEYKDIMDQDEGELELEMGYGIHNPEKEEFSCTEKKPED